MEVFAVLASVQSMGLTGIQGYPVTVEAYCVDGMPMFEIVGLPDAAVKESRERVRAAMSACHTPFPVARLTLNLAPADVRKEGPAYDLPIALAILAAMGRLDAETMAGMAAERFKYQARQGVNNFLRSFLELLFQSVSLVLDTLRTFFLIVLSILGPLSFAISVYDGFHNTMIQWICQYISIYLWLPISDLFSSVLARIQVLMIEKDIAALSDPAYVPDVNNSAYIIFMLIAIVGYFTIPTVSTWVIQASGAGNYGKQVNSWSLKGGRAAAAVSGAAVGHVAGKLRGR